VKLMMGDELRLRHKCPSGRPPWEGTGHVVNTGGSSEEVRWFGQLRFVGATCAVVHQSLVNSSLLALLVLWCINLDRAVSAVGSGGGLWHVLCTSELCYLCQPVWYVCDCRMCASRSAATDAGHSVVGGGRHLMLLLSTSLYLSPSIVAASCVCTASAATCTALMPLLPSVLPLCLGRARQHVPSDSA
jgi:hypothetical protein